MILVFGVIMVYEASVVYSDNVFGGKYHFLLLQLNWALIGVCFMLLFSIINLDFLKRISPILFVISLVTLLFILIPTIFSPEVYGARRWLILNPEPLLAIPFLGRLGFQPSELAKFTCILYFASFLTSEKREKSINPVEAAKYFAMLAIVIGFVFLEPNFSTAFIIAMISIVIFFFSNASIMYFLTVFPTFISVVMGYMASSEYRRDRIKTLFDPENIDKLGAGYHIRQIMITLGSGGFWGLGFGKSVQKYSYLPEVTADSIFAIVGEEFGFVGTLFLVVTLAFLIFRGLKIAQKADNRYHMLLAVGVMTWFSVQTLINIGAMARLIPLTGIPLPLVSYGGSSMVFMLCGLGLVLNVSRYSKIDNDG